VGRRKNEDHIERVVRDHLTGRFVVPAGAALKVAVPTDTAFGFFVIGYLAAAK
jgi:hypothetical protein